FDGPKFNECATTAFAADADRSKPEGATPGPVTVSPLEVTPRGQRTLAYRIELQMNLQDLPVPISQDFLIVFNGGTVIRLLFLNPGGPFPQNLENTLVDSVVGRA